MQHPIDTEGGILYIPGGSLPQYVATYAKIVLQTPIQVCLNDTQINTTVYKMICLMSTLKQSTSRSITALEILLLFMYSVRCV